ncbi:MAG: Excinuclease ABC C subunit domain protein [Parcubacteria group bacterium Gr01-1014_19]|nr:MAG: Excinuclease ABC C subunit domain protein [Parcubacteria group bacterium Gr01-1014_19]
MEATCEVCGQHKEGVAKNKKTGLETCRSCYREHNQPKHYCILCFQLAPAGFITEDKKAVCAGCVAKMRNRGWTIEEALKFPKVFNPKVRVRHRQKTKNYPVHGGLCEVCGHEKKDVNKNRKTGKMTCYGCYVRTHCPKEPCVLCGKLKRVAARSNGRPACKGCLEHKICREICAVCCKKKRVQTRNSEGRAICPRCAEKANKKKAS